MKSTRGNICITCCTLTPSFIKPCLKDFKKIRKKLIHVLQWGGPKNGPNKQNEDSNDASNDAV